MSNITSTNSPMRSRPTTKDIGVVDPSIRVDQQQSTVFSSEIFDPGPSTVAPSEATWANQGLGAVIQPVNSQPSETELESKFAQLSKRIDQFSKQLHELNANFKLVNARLDSLESQAASTPAAEPAVTVLASQLETRFESLENIFQTQCKMINGFFTNAGTNAGDVKVKVNTEPVAEAEVNLVTNSAPAATTEPTVAEPTVTEPTVTEPAVTEPAAVTELVAETEQAAMPEPVAAPVEKDPGAHWQEQKQAMMVKYGFDSETTEPQAATPAQPNNNQSEVAAPAPTVDTPAATEETTVDELKRQLNSKIREAEVEMSINRARLMQERVEFERAQTELERRAAMLEAKLAASTGNETENVADESDDSMMGRFKRHLGNS